MTKFVFDKGEFSVGVQPNEVPQVPSGNTELEQRNKELEEENRKLKDEIAGLK